MKKIRLFSLMLALLLLAGCGGRPSETPAPGDAAAGDGSALAGNPDVPELQDDITCADPPGSQPCRIVDGAEDGNLLLASLPGGVYDGGVFRLTVTGDTEVWMDGEQITAAGLQDGMSIDVVFRGGVQESFPARFEDVQYLVAYPSGSERNPGGTLYDLCGLYLQVLDDLWQVDPALNSDISTAIVDLSDAPGMDTLTDAEKAALLWRFGELHSVTALDAADPSAAEHLESAGYYDSCGSEIKGLDDACLFTIRTHTTDEPEFWSLPVLRFDASKWCGPLAAYCFYDCTAVWAEFGPWGGYQVGAEMIS